MNLYALLLEAFAGECLNLLILDGKYLRQYLNDGHIGTEGFEKGGKFDSDRARADDQQRFRNAIRRHRLEVSPDQLLVRLDARQHARARAGRNDDVLCLIGAGAERALRSFTLRGLHSHFARRVDRGLAPDDRDLVFLHEKADAVVEPLRHGA